MENEEDSDTQELKLDHTYVTQFGTVNAVSYPCFLFDFPENWTVTKEEVSQTDETVVLTNERGSTITYTYIGGVAEGQLGSGSATDMTRIELSAVADSQFIPGYVDARNYADLGKFVVAETKITGTKMCIRDSLPCCRTFCLYIYILLFQKNIRNNIDFQIAGCFVVIPGRQFTGIAVQIIEHIQMCIRDRYTLWCWFRCT